MMVRVNRNKLPQKDLDKLFTHLYATLGRLDQNGAEILLKEILGEEERLTIAKRIAALVLLLENYSQYQTAKLLKLSPSTTEKIKTGIDSGKYDGAIELFGSNKKNYFAILEVIDAVLHLGGILPHYNGLDRYKGL